MSGWLTVMASRRIGPSAIRHLKTCRQLFLAVSLALDKQLDLGD